MVSRSCPGFNSRADEKLAEQIENAEAPFWAHVRDALAERHP